jgi:hypothetical protein
MARLGCNMAHLGCGMAQIGCGLAQLVACRAAVKAPSSNLGSAPQWRPSIAELAAMKKIERNSANVMNECE